MVALLVGGAPLAQAPEPAQDDSIEAIRTRAEAGDAFSQFYLGASYNSGEGVPQDAVEAVAWYRQAAEQGYAHAQHNLGVNYRNGEGVPQDAVEAYKWFNLSTVYAYASTRETSAKQRDIVAESLTPEQLAEGQKLSREWFAAHPPPERDSSVALTPTPRSHPLVGFSKTQIRLRFGPPSREGIYAWHYETPGGVVGIYFDENSRVEGLSPSDVDLNDLPSPPPELMDDVDPRTLVGLTMDEVTVRYGQPSTNLGSRWGYSTRGGLVTLVFEGTGANGQVVAEVQTPQYVFPRR